MFSKVLLPVDIDSPESWETAFPAARHCVATGGEIHLLGIVHDLGSAMVSSFLPPDYEKTAMETLKARIVELADQLGPADVTLEAHVGHGHVAETILRVADQIGADLIVMASHPANDFQTLLVGSNAEKVVRHATVPVMTLRRGS